MTNKKIGRVWINCIDGLSDEEIDYFVRTGQIKGDGLLGEVVQIYEDIATYDDLTRAFPSDVPECRETWSIYNAELENAWRKLYGLLKEIEGLGNG